MTSKEADVRKLKKKKEARHANEQAAKKPIKAEKQT